MRRRSKQIQGVALVLTLAMLVLITILVVGLSTILTTERRAAHTSLQSQNAKVMAEIARDHAIALIRDGIASAEATYTATDPTQRKFWASQPGRITVFNASGTVDTASSRDLLSGTNSSQAEVDLNRATFSGNNPIASAASVGATNAPALAVNWINVLQNPNHAAGSINAVVGRYAFWVDDETSKINVNTADGTSKYVDPNYANAPSSAPASYGDGMPTEISLAALTNAAASTNITTAMAQNIASITGIRPGSASTRYFGSAAGILQPTGIPSNVYQDNNFNLTHYSRSPELNIFGEPKIYLMTAGNTNGNNYNPFPASNLSIGPYAVEPNGGYQAGLPIKQIYPSSNPLIITYSGFPQAYIGNDVTQTGVGNQLPPFLHAPPFNIFFNTFVGSPNNIPLPQYFAYYTFNTKSLIGAALGNYPGTYWDNNKGAGYMYYDYYMGLRIAQYLKGYNSSGNPINWPIFLGSNVNGFAGKYTDRQIDSITMQLMDIMAKDKDVDVNHTVSVPTVLPHGFLSPLPTKGVGRFPHLTQVFITFTVTPGNPPLLAMTTEIQWWVPKGYKGAQLEDAAYAYQFTPNGDGYMNAQDLPGNWPSGSAAGGGGSPLGGAEPYWACNMLNIKGQDGVDSGVDLFGNDSADPDPDQNAAAIFHYNCFDDDPASIPNPNYPKDPNPTIPNPNPLAQKYTGSGPYSGGVFHFTPALIACPSTPLMKQDWTSGNFRSTKAGTYSYSATTAYQLRYYDPTNPYAPQPPQVPLPALTSITFGGGITLWGGNNGAYNPFPLDSFRGSNTGESLSDPNVRAAVLAAVIPLPTNPPLTLPVSYVPGVGAVGTVLMKVADPMVDNMPGDWISIANPSPSDVTLIPCDSPKIAAEAANGASDSGYGEAVAEYPNGANIEFQAAGGGDPNSYWLPEINQNNPKSQRFPSVGYMQYIRTGIMPDKADDVTGNTNDPSYIAPTDPSYAAKYQAQHGTPFRLLSMAPSYDPTKLPAIAANPGQTTAGGGSYPDWAMLDLFTTPVSPQPVQGTAANLPPYLEMTYGGSTPGRVNVNSPNALAPFGEQSSRLGPLKAVFKNVQVSNSYSAPSLQNALEDPIVTTVDESALASAINAYQTNLVDANGISRPFLMPEEIANVPAVAKYVYDGTQNNPPTTLLPKAALSRNDLLRQTLGNLTTQSNTFSVWAVGQSIRKIPGNSNYGTVESGDQVVGESRTHYIIERYIDLGVDGVPGNAKAGGAGDDGILGTPDDVIDGDDTPGHIVAGANPKMTYPLPYKYRVIATEEIAN